MRAPEALGRYDVGEITAVTPWGGTAGRAFRVSTVGAEYFLRRRGARTSSAERISFDHGLRRHLDTRGIPTALPLPSRDGSCWVSEPDGIWELYPFMPGHEHRSGDRRELRSVARTLAAFHAAGAELRGASASAPLVDQFGLAAPGTPRSSRLDDPACMREAIRSLSRGLGGVELQRAQAMLGLVDRIEESYGAASYGPLDTALVHGDFHSSNLLFGDDDEVCGLFDFDWALWGPRVRDLADAVHFFAGTPTRGGADIWALTSARDVSEDLASELLHAYVAVSPLSRAELRALDWAWLARWIAIHIEGCAKVPPGERGAFLTREVLEGAERILAFDAAALIAG